MDGLAPGLNSIRPGSISEAPIGLIKKANLSSLLLFLSPASLPLALATPPFPAVIKMIESRTVGRAPHTLYISEMPWVTVQCSP